MKRHLSIFLVAVILNVHGYAQGNYMTREGSVSFYSSAPLEDIEAVNSRVQAVLDTGTGEVAVRMRIEDFSFRKSLMQKHFNENYMESHLYPEARFSGSIENFDPDSFREGTREVVVKGTLTIHGVARETSVGGSLGRSGPHYVFRGTFPVKVEDHDIRVPRLLVRNIAEVVEVTIDLRLAPVN